VTSAQSGYLACGTYKNTPELFWTNNAKFFYGYAQGFDAAALTHWWANDT
jgi:hypothetical protein